MNYSNTTTYKTALIKTRSAEGGWTNAAELTSFIGLWRSTAAITSVSIGANNSKSLPVGCTFSLYGIAAA
jgi:hypothetical protein